METVKPIINKVAQRALVNLDLEDYFPTSGEIEEIDLAQYLFKGLLLREADFREAVKTTNWASYRDRYVVIYCSADAIIPMWAYMVLSAEVALFAKDVVSSLPAQAAQLFLCRNLAKLDMQAYKGQRVIVKGCGSRVIPEAAFVQIAEQLAKVARVIMYGEACSTVPIFKPMAE